MKVITCLLKRFVLVTALCLMTVWISRADDLWAPRFFGSDSYVMVGTPDALQIPSGAPFTVEGWMRFEAFSTRDMLYSKNNARGAPYSYMFGFADGNMAAYDGGVWRGSFSVARVTDRWYHLAFAYDGTNMVFYLDGDELGSAPFSFNNNINHSIKIGGYAAAADIRGMKFDVRVWGHARTGDQIRRYMPFHLSGLETGLLGYWRLDEGLGLTAHDATSAANHGELTESVLWDPRDLILSWFGVVNPLTGSTRFTNTNQVDVLVMRMHPGYDRYQITLNGMPPDDDPEIWIATSSPLETISFATPATDTKVLLTAWFTNSTPSVALISNSTEIVYTTAKPESALVPVTRYVVDGVTTVTIEFADIDDGTTGGEYDGEPIPFTTALFSTGDTTPDQSFVTLDTIAEHEVVVTVTNAAGNVAVATNTVSILPREPTLYVRADAPFSTPPYDSWETAAASLHDALAVAGPDDTLLVAGQTFVLTSEIELPYSGMTIRGGYEATETDPDHLPGPNDPEQWPTVITRDLSGAEFRLFSIERLENVALENIELRRGFQREYRGGGLYAVSVTNLHLANIRFVENSAWREAQVNEFGGGMYAEQSSGSISNSVFLNNTVRRGTYGTAFGGGLCLIGGNWTVAHSVFSANLAFGNHSGLRGAALYVQSGQHVLRNILAFHNGRHSEISTTHGGAIYIEGAATVSIDNATVHGHSGPGLFVNANSSVSVRNSILYDNIPDISGTPTLQHNCIGDGSEVGVNGNIAVDPLFETPLYYLAVNSPAVNAGTGTVSEAGLAGWTSHTNGALYAGTVNMGYHHPEGVLFDLDLYVAPDGDDGGDGEGWPTAVRSITRALELAGSRTRIHLAAGNYTNGVEQFPLLVDGQTVQLIGAGSDQTVIDADNSNTRVLTVRNSLGVRIEGLTIRGGRQTGREGGGIFVEGSLLTLYEVVLRDNSLYAPGQISTYGGGLAAIRSGVLVDASLVASNYNRCGLYPTAFGGGIAILNGTANIRRSRIVGNRLDSPNASRSRGAAIAVSDGLVEVRNSLVASNVTVRFTEANHRVAGIFSWVGGRLRIENSTIAYNNSDGLWAENDTQLFNTILWGNALNDYTNVTASAFFNSCAPGLTNHDQGNIANDPQFVDAAAGDYRLRLESPAVDAGLNRPWMTGALDLQGIPRVLYGRSSTTVDMGAYETIPLRGSVILFR